MTKKAIAIVATALALVSGSTPVAQAEHGEGVVRVYSQVGWRGASDHIETTAENRGWCIRVSDTRSLKNQSRYAVKYYRSMRCNGTHYPSQTLGAGKWVSNTKFVVQSVRIARTK